MHDAPERDAHFMRRALQLAAKGLGRVEPNPMVGAVVVREGVIVGQAFHRRFGGLHAEPLAIAAAGESCEGATLYVTLEPCTGAQKKTPPCCDAVIRAGFRRVVIGARDPTREPAVPRLEAAGIKVTTGVLEDECAALIAPFLKLHLARRPFVVAKWAMTADGKIATATGDSKWISSEKSRRLVHKWRGQVNAVLVGAGTARRDDPLLTCRPPGPRRPLRIVLDSKASLPTESRLVRTVHEAPLMIACHISAPEADRSRLADAGCRIATLPGENDRPDPEALLDLLGAEKLTYLLVEGGAQVLGRFFEKNLIDEVRVFIAPSLAGGAAAPGPIAGAGIASMADAARLHRARWRRIGPDMLLTGRITHATPTAPRPSRS